MFERILTRAEGMMADDPVIEVASTTEGTKVPLPGQVDEAAEEAARKTAADQAQAAREAAQSPQTNTELKTTAQIASEKADKMVSDAAAKAIADKAAKEARIAETAEGIKSAKAALKEMPLALAPTAIEAVDDLAKGRPGDAAEKVVGAGVAIGGAAALGRMAPKIAEAGVKMAAKDGAGALAKTTGAALELGGKGFVKAIPVIGEVAGIGFAGYDMVEAAKAKDTRRAWASGIEASLYTAAAGTALTGVGVVASPFLLGGGLAISAAKALSDVGWLGHFMDSDGFVAGKPIPKAQPVQPPQLTQAQIDAQAKLAQQTAEKNAAMQVVYKNSWDMSKSIVEQMADPKTGLAFAKSLNDGSHRLQNAKLRAALGLGSSSDPLEPTELAERVKELQAAAKELPMKDGKIDWDAVYSADGKYADNAYAKAVKAGSQQAIESLKDNERSDLGRQIGHAHAAALTAAEVAVTPTAAPGAVATAPGASVTPGQQATPQTSSAAPAAFQQTMLNEMMPIARRQDQQQELANQMAAERAALNRLVAGSAVDLAKDVYNHSSHHRFLKDLNPENWLDKNHDHGFTKFEKQLQEDVAKDPTAYKDLAPDLKTIHQEALRKQQPDGKTAGHMATTIYDHTFGTEDKPLPVDGTHAMLEGLVAQLDKDQKGLPVDLKPDEQMLQTARNNVRKLGGQGVGFNTGADEVTAPIQKTGRVATQTQVVDVTVTPAIIEQHGPAGTQQPVLTPQ